MVLFGGVLACGAALLVMAIRRSGTRWIRAPLRQSPGALIALSFFGAYAIVILMTMWFLDPATRADVRILSPLLVALLVFVAAVVPRMSVGATRAVAATAMIVVGLYLFTTVDDARNGPIRDRYLPYTSLSHTAI